MKYFTEKLPPEETNKITESIKAKNRLNLDHKLRQMASEHKNKVNEIEGRKPNHEGSNIYGI